MYCKLAFEVSVWCFYRRKIIRNVVAILLEKAFEICLFLIKEVCEQTTSFNYYKYGYFLHYETLKNISCGCICC